MTKRERDRAKMQFQRELADGIKRERENAGLSQSGLAALVPGWSQATVSKWETGFLRPSAYNIAQLCKALKAKPADLIPRI